MPSEPEPLTALLDRSYPTHLALARRFVGEHDAPDVVQESYLRAWRSYAGFRHESAAATWLHAIVANTARTWLRRATRRRADPLDEQAESPDPSATRHDPARAGELAGVRQSLSAALARLDEPQRAVVLLKDVAGLSHTEIAATLDITEGASKVRLHRARHRLRSLLDSELAPVA